MDSGLASEGPSVDDSVGGVLVSCRLTVGCCCSGVVGLITIGLGELICEGPSSWPVLPSVAAGHKIGLIVIICACLFFF